MLGMAWSGQTSQSITPDALMVTLQVENERLWTDWGHRGQRQAQLVGVGAGVWGWGWGLRQDVLEEEQGMGREA